MTKFGLRNVCDSFVNRLFREVCTILEKFYFSDSSIGLIAKTSPVGMIRAVLLGAIRDDLGEKETF